MDANTDIENDLENNAAGYHVDVNDYNKLVDKIELLAGNEEIQKQYSDNCKNVFLNNYTTDICTNKYVELFNELLEDKNVQR